MNVSSVGGLRAFPSNGIYCATKFALEAVTEALRAEVRPFNINVVSVQPGYFRTRFLAAAAAAAAASSSSSEEEDSQGNGNREFLAPKIDAYEGTPAHDAREAFGVYNGAQPGDPTKAAARMWEYVDGGGLFEDKKEKLGRLPLGKDTGGIMLGLAEELRRTAEYYQDVWGSTDFDSSHQ